MVSPFKGLESPFDALWIGSPSDIQAHSQVTMVQVRPWCVGFDFSAWIWLLKAFLQLELRGIACKRSSNHSMQWPAEGLILVGLPLWWVAMFFHVMPSLTLASFPFLSAAYLACPTAKTRQAFMLPSWTLACLHSALQAG